MVVIIIRDDMFYTLTQLVGFPAEGNKFFYHSVWEEFDFGGVNHKGHTVDLLCEVRLLHIAWRVRPYRTAGTELGRGRRRERGRERERRGREKER